MPEIVAYFDMLNELKNFFENGLIRTVISISASMNGKLIHIFYAYF